MSERLNNFLGIDSGADNNQLKWSNGKLTEKELKLVKDRLDSEGRINYKISLFPISIDDSISSSQARFISAILQESAVTLGNDSESLKFTLLQEKITGGGKIAVSFNNQEIDADRALIALVGVIQESDSKLKKSGQPRLTAPVRNIFTLNH